MQRQLGESWHKNPPLKPISPHYQHPLLKTNCSPSLSIHHRSSDHIPRKRPKVSDTASIRRFTKQPRVSCPPPPRYYRPSPRQLGTSLVIVIASTIHAASRFVLWPQSASHQSVSPLEIERLCRYAAACAPVCRFVFVETRRQWRGRVQVSGLHMRSRLRRETERERMRGRCSRDLAERVGDAAGNSCARGRGA